MQLKKIVPISTIIMILAISSHSLFSAIPTIDAAMLSATQIGNAEKLLRMVEQLNVMKDELNVASRHLQTANSALQIGTETLQVSHEIFRISGDPESIKDLLFRIIDRVNYARSIYTPNTSKTTDDTQKRVDIYEDQETVGQIYSTGEALQSRLEKQGDSIYKKDIADQYLQNSIKVRQNFDKVIDESNRIAQKANLAKTDIEVQKAQTNMLNQVVASIQTLTEEQRLANQMHAYNTQVNAAKEQIDKEKRYMDAQRKAILNGVSDATISEAMSRLQK